MTQRLLTVCFKPQRISSVICASQVGAPMCLVGEPLGQTVRKIPARTREVFTGGGRRLGKLHKKLSSADADPGNLQQVFLCILTKKEKGGFTGKLNSVRLTFGRR